MNTPGENEAFHGLFSRYQKVAVAYAHSILKNAADAEDAAQAAFLRAWLRRIDLREPEAFGAWLRASVLSECCHIMRQARFAKVPHGGQSFVSDVLIGYLADQSAIELLDALQTLSRSDRSLIKQRYIRGLAYPELCQCLQAPLTTVKKRLHNVHRRLRVRMTLVVSETSPRQKRRG